jgi:hypothetical protein
MQNAVICFLSCCCLFIPAPNTVASESSELAGWQPKEWFYDAESKLANGTLNAIDNTTIVLVSGQGHKATLPIDALCGADKLYLRACQLLRRAGYNLKSSAYPGKHEELYSVYQRLRLPGIGGISHQYAYELSGSFWLPANSPATATMGTSTPTRLNQYYIGSRPRNEAVVDFGDTFRWIVHDGREYKIVGIKPVPNISAIDELVVEDTQGTRQVIDPSIWGNRLQLLPRYWTGPSARLSNSGLKEAVGRLPAINVPEIPSAVLHFVSLPIPGEKTPRKVWTHQSIIDAYRWVDQSLAMFAEAAKQEQPVAFRYHSRTGDRFFFAGEFERAIPEYAVAAAIHDEIGNQPESGLTFLRLGYSRVVGAIQSSVDHGRSKSQPAVETTALSHAYADFTTALSIVKDDLVFTSCALEGRARCQSLLGLAEPDDASAMRFHRAGIADAVAISIPDYLDNDTPALSGVRQLLRRARFSEGLRDGLYSTASNDRHRRAETLLHTGFELWQARKSFVLLSYRSFVAAYNLARSDIVDSTYDPDLSIALPAQEFRARLLSDRAVAEPNDILAIKSIHKQAINAAKSISKLDTTNTIYFSDQPISFPSFIEPYLLRKELLPALQLARTNDQIKRSNRLLGEAVVGIGADSLETIQEALSRVDRALDIADDPARIEQPATELHGRLDADLIHLRVETQALSPSEARADLEASINRIKALPIDYRLDGLHLLAGIPADLCQEIVASRDKSFSRLSSITDREISSLDRNALAALSVRDQLIAGMALRAANEFRTLANQQRDKANTLRGSTMQSFDRAIDPRTKWKKQAFLDARREVARVKDGLLSAQCLIKADHDQTTHDDAISLEDEAESYIRTHLVSFTKEFRVETKHRKRELLNALDSFAEEEPVILDFQWRLESAFAHFWAREGDFIKSIECISDSEGLRTRLRASSLK